MRRSKGNSDCNIRADYVDSVTRRTVLKYEVLIYGSPVLREKAIPIEKVDSSVRQLAKDMLETMYGGNGIGLSAEQVGRTESICVIDVSAVRESGDENESQSNPDVLMPLVMVNPEISLTSGEQTGQEGCLSFPEIFISIKRAEKVTVRFINRDNQEETVRASGLLARVIQHEVDHLHGILFVDRMSPVQKVAIAGKLKRLRRS